jgi:NADPH:quinone reductase-like Zn-dependent oxidoreductase
VKWFWLPLRLAIGIFRPRRPILGGYLSGEVAALGPGVSEFAVGDAVFGSAGLRLGGYGEYVALPASSTFVTKPRTMTFEEAAAVPLGGLNALHFIRLAKIRPGEQVLVNGAGGSIGIHAVQIAKAMGAVVTAVDTAAKEARIRDLGADRFIDYRTTSFADGAEKYDVLFDMVPGSDYAANIRSLKPGGRYLSGNPTLRVMLRSFFTNRFTDKTSSFAFARETREELSALRDMIDAGKLRSIVDRVLPMEQAAEAHRLVESEERRGAIVIRICADAGSLSPGESVSAERTTVQG